MEFKKKTIIWEDNNEPPKDYIWVKSDGKAYEYSYSQRKWIESKLIKTEESGGSDGGDDGGASSSDVFFVPATIQPKYFVNNPYGEPIEIKNYTSNMISIFLYNKEDIISLGVNEEDLNNLDYIKIINAFIDVNNNNGANGFIIQQSAFDNKIILSGINNMEVYTCGIRRDCYVYKIEDDVFLILESTPVSPEPI